MFPAVGKHGKRQSCQSKEPTANEWNDSVGAPRLRRNDALRHLVVATVARFSRLSDLYRLFHLGGVSGEELFLWQLHLAILFPRNRRRFTAQLVRTQAQLVARLAYFLSRAVGSLGSWWISPDLLLL